MKKLVGIISMLIIFTLVISACGSNKDSAADNITVKIGILKNVTHASGFVALQNGYFQDVFGKNAKIEVTGFDNGSDFSTAMATNQIDLGFVGPGPAINQ